MMWNTRWMKSEEEQLLCWADLQLELQDALKKDTDDARTKMAEAQQKRDEETVLQKRKLDDSDSKLDGFIKKVNKQADAIDELKVILETDKLRYLKVKETLEKRLADINRESNEMELLIQECSSLHISNFNRYEIEELKKACAELVEVFANELRSLKADTHSKIVTLKEMQKSYERVVTSKERIEIREETKQLHKERREQLQARILDETVILEVTEETLKKAAAEDEKTISELEAAEQYLEKLKEEIQETEAKNRDIASRETDISKELKKIEDQCREKEALISALQAKYKLIADESDECNKLYSCIQRERKQRHQHIMDLNKERQEVNKMNKSSSIAMDHRQAADSEVEASSECVIRRLRNRIITEAKHLNETFGTIEFDPVQLVASTPLVSPKSKSSERCSKDLKCKPSTGIKTMKNSFDLERNVKRHTRRAIRRTGKVSRKAGVRTSRAVKNPVLQKTKRVMYEMLDSE